MIGTWIAAIGTLGLMSFAIKENPFYRFVEHVFVGIGAAHGLVMGWENIQSNALTPMTENGKFVLIIPMILGLLLYARFIKSQAWLSRFPMAVLVGLGVGMTIKGTIGAQIITQISSTLKPLNSIDNIIIAVGVTSVLMFFYFTRKRKKGDIFDRYSSLGRYIMMIAFGALFGNAVMGRMSLMIGRVQFILGDWLHLI